LESRERGCDRAISIAIILSNEARSQEQLGRIDPRTGQIINQGMGPLQRARDARTATCMGVNNLRNALNNAVRSGVVQTLENTLEIEE